jgi:O-antigen ligase
MKKLNRVLYLYYLFFFLLPFQQQLSLWAFVLLCLASLYSFFTAPRPIVLKQCIAWPLLLLFIIYTVSLAYTDKSNFISGVNYIGRVSPFFILPIVFALNKEVIFNNRLNLLKAFILGNLIVFLFSFGRAVFRSIGLNNSFKFDAAVIKGTPFFESVTQGGNYFFSHELSIFHHPTYFSVSLLLSLFSIIHLNVNKKLDLRTTIILIIIVIFSLFLLSSRSALLILIVVSILYIVKLKKYKFLYFYFALLIILGGLNPRIVNMRNYKSNLEQLDPSTRYDFGLRLLTWNASVEIIKQNWLVGTGVGDAQEELLKIYKNKHYTYPLQKSLNSHNQFLQTFTETGLTGLLVLLLAFYIGFKQAKTDIVFNLYLFILILFLIDFLFESSLRRYYGIIMFTTFYSFMWIINSCRNSLNKNIIQRNVLI